ncbi:MAG TPA: sigma-54 dependent transcriptional regulator [Pirellulales bacterium]|nr:sigma-54 dependent transcriptional regulator [Pirellulales bacterium]
MARLLIVDDEPTICWGLSRLAQRMRHEAAVASTAEEALQLAHAHKFDAVIMDVRLPGMDGLTAAAKLRKIVGPVPIVIITAYGNLAVAVEAVRGGAFEYLVKPFDLETVERVIRRALESRRASPGPSVAAPPIDDELIGSTPAMQQVFKSIAMAAPAAACVQIHGESGTGKELVARAIHRFSRRSAGPFVAVNLASLSETVAESELFGHVRGAFTGAEQSRVGLVEQAQAGTLFLDEVAEIPLSLQVKLLRTLERGEVLPVGSSEPRKVDFRVVSATHRDLADCVAKGTFREDLFFRLNTFAINLPALRERTADIRTLAEHFLDRLAQKSGQPRASLTDEALTELERRRWPGNVRELRNAIEHALIVARGGWIGPEHFPPSHAENASRSTAGDLLAAVRAWAEEQYSDSDPVNVYDRLVETVEIPLLQVAFDRHQGQHAAAARTLGLHRMTVRKKMERVQRPQEHA